MTHAEETPKRKTMAGKKLSQGKSPLKQSNLLGFFTKAKASKSAKASPQATPTKATDGQAETAGKKESKQQQKLFADSPSASPSGEAASRNAQQAGEPNPAKKPKQTDLPDNGDDGGESSSNAEAQTASSQQKQQEKAKTKEVEEEEQQQQPQRSEEEQEEDHEEEVTYTRRGRRVRRVVRYFESDSDSDSGDDEEQEAVRRALRSHRRNGGGTAAGKGRGRRSGGGGSGKRVINSDASDSDEYVPDDDEEEALAEEDAEDEDEMLKTTTVVREDEESPVEEPESDILDENDEEEEEEERPKRKRSKRTASSRRKASSASSSPSSGVAGRALTSAGSGVAAFDIPTTGRRQGSSNGSPERYQWLAKPRDKNKRTPDHPEYDPTSLYIPPSAWAKMTPFEKQYWDIKQHHWNTILFFKKGKFYELYERDAEIGHREFQLKMTDRVNMCMAGVPEITFPDWAARFLANGFKVARVDERENAIAKKMRETKTGKKGPRIIERKLCAVYTQGTLMGDFVIGDMSNFIMSIKEDEEARTYGICFADTATAEFNMCHFTDDAARTAFETLIVQVMPKELVLCKKNLSKETMAILKSNVGGSIFNWLEPNTEFWTSQITIDSLEKGRYFAASANDGATDEARTTNETQWPKRLAPFLSKDAAMSALGGLVSYFKKLLLDKSLLTQGTFYAYDPLHHGATLVLDGQTLQNLDVLCNMHDGTTSGSLLELLCQCHTAFGKRMFRRWLCHPLRRVADIEERQSAVVDFTDHPDLRDAIASMLKPLPDLERLMSRVHVGNCKLSDVIALLESMDAVMECMLDIDKIAAGCTFQSQHLQKLTKVGSLFPDMREELKAIASIFDRHEAKKTDKLTPQPGALPEYDDAVDAMDGIEKRLNEHLLSVRREFGAGKNVSFWQPSAGRERYQIQVPVAMQKKVPSTWKLMSSTKNYKRYHSPRAMQLVGKYLEAEETISQCLKSFFSHVLGAINKHREKFGAAVSALSQLDCLLSLFRAKDSMGAPMCRPVFIDPEQGDHPDTDGGGGEKRAVLDLKQMRHPCLQHARSITDYIPNDTHIGGRDASTMVLTGPNMGGKSTLLRQTCIAVIMAQLGCWVPAESFTLTPVDRIFTRIGANDNIVAGRSTFMVELKETATILNKASGNSLVILDELGRGTSTFDGYAIAYAVLSHITQKIRCRCMFATHYHLLTDELKDNPNVINYNMACVVDDHQKDVTFLYKLQPGVCSKSYGMNVAHMAGVLDSIVEGAKEKAVQYEATSRFGKIQDRKSKQLALYRFAARVKALVDAQGEDAASSDGSAPHTAAEKVQALRRGLEQLRPILRKLEEGDGAK